jgi:hypothetical protein
MDKSVLKYSIAPQLLWLNNNSSSMHSDEASLELRWLHCREAAQVRVPEPPASIVYCDGGGWAETKPW